jgi:hypothetical protein
MRERNKLLTDEQIQEKIGSRRMDLRAKYKTVNLVVSMFALSFLALTLVLIVPDEYREAAMFWAWTHWLIYLIWTILLGFVWRTLPDWESKQLTEEERCRRLHLQTMGFHLWRGGFLLPSSTLLLLLGLGSLKYLGQTNWVDGVVVGGYSLLYLFSFWQKRFISHVRLEGWPTDSQWKRSLIQLGGVGSVGLIATCSSMASLLARLRIVPAGVAYIVIGMSSIVLASVTVPVIVFCFIEAWVHLQIARRR